MSHTVDKQYYQKKDLPGGISKAGFVLTAAGLLILVIAFLFDKTRASFNSLILLMFLSSIGVGSLFLVALEYLGGAVWSTPFRRISEFLASIVLILPLIAVPVYLNLHDLFHWTHADAVATDKILAGKAPYLNEGFFTIRVVVYFLIWILFYYLITNNSKKQDQSGDQKLTTKNIRLSAGFMPLFAISITFGAIDWLMSLEPHWFSTIYGVYYFSGTVLASLAVLTYAMVSLSEKGYFGDKILKDHYYSFGALMFGFVNFWAYIAFSQLILIWYANLPEETFWFIQRWEGQWMYVSLLFILVHFLVPYFGLLAQPSKMNPKRLKFMSLWILFAHYFDMYWLVMPTYSKGEAPLSWFELGGPLLAVGIILLVFNMKSKKNNLMPIGDPKLKRGLDFRF